MKFVYAIKRKTSSVSAMNAAAPSNAKVFLEDINLFTGSKDAIKQLGNLTYLEIDLLVIASAIFAADRASKRGEREDISRTIDLYIPVYNLDKLISLAPILKKLLRDLSQDNWSLFFLSLNKQTSDGFVDEGSFVISSAEGRALLFSGGLDSLGAAVEFGKESLLLVSHLTKNSFTRRSQDDLFELLTKKGYVTTHQQYFVSSADLLNVDIEHSIESSQRTRSFVFLTIGVIAARRKGVKELILMAENGQMAIHLPLTSGRIGAFSTHTAHPAVLAGAESFFELALSTAIKIRNPYLYKTKAQVVEPIIKNLPESIPLSTSCWKNTRVSQSGTTHCGQCIPCYIRKISIEFYQADPTTYARDIWNENIEELDDDDDGRRNLIDLLEFVYWFNKKTDDDLMCEFPELYSENFEATEAIKMYRKFAVEALTVFSNYPYVEKLLKG
jgi:7-cyano-7-deazaguanine synthase in queuosine biosynthesis